MTAAFDTGAPAPARVYDYLLGGSDNYPADRAAADQVLRVFPGGRGLAWANRRFLWRAVRFCASQERTGLRVLGEVARNP